MADKPTTTKPVEKKIFKGKIVENFYYKKKEYYSKNPFETDNEKLFQYLLTTKRIIE
jgi:hypothetical protein